MLLIKLEHFLWLIHRQQEFQFFHPHRLECLVTNRYSAMLNLSDFHASKSVLLRDLPTSQLLQIDDYEESDQMPYERQLGDLLKQPAIVLKLPHPTNFPQLKHHIPNHLTPSLWLFCNPQPSSQFQFGHNKNSLHVDESWS